MINYISGLLQPPRRFYSTNPQVVRKQIHAPNPIHQPQSKPVPAVTQQLPVPTVPARGRPHLQSIGLSSVTTRTGNIHPVSNRGTPSPTSAVIPQRPSSVPPITTAAGNQPSTRRRVYQPQRPVNQPVATRRYVHQPRRPVSQPVATPFSLQELKALDLILDSYLKTPSPYVTPPTRAPYTNYNNYEYTNSDCDCQKDSDSCSSDQYYNGDCEDGVECCGRW